MAKFKNTWEEIMARSNSVPCRKRPSDEEHRIQVACVNWLRYMHPECKDSLFAVPNGGRRDRVTGAKLKAEGVLSGVADLILLKPNKQYHALCIEMKTRKGSQAETQKAWQRHVEKDGYKYIVCRSLDDFIEQVTNYLNN